MAFLIQLFDGMAISLGLATNFGYCRLKPIRKLSPHEIKDSTKSRSANAHDFVGWRICQIRLSHQAADAAAMAGNKLPALREATTL